MRAKRINTTGRNGVEVVPKMSRSLSASIALVALFSVFLVSIFSSFAVADHDNDGGSCSSDNDCGGFGPLTHAECKVNTGGTISPITHWGACEDTDGDGSDDTCVRHEWVDTHTTCYSPPHDACIQETCRILSNGGESTGVDHVPGIPVGGEVARCRPAECSRGGTDTCPNIAGCGTVTKEDGTILAFAYNCGCTGETSGGASYCNGDAKPCPNGCEEVTEADKTVAKCKLVATTTTGGIPADKTNRPGYVPEESSQAYLLNSSEAFSQPRGPGTPSQVSWLVAVALFVALVLAGWNISKGK